MRIVTISDTHCEHGDLRLPKADVLIHTGDSCLEGTLSELKDFGEWLVRQPYARKIIVLGNHDIVADRLAGRQYLDTVQQRGVEILHDDRIDLNGFTVWGTPHSQSSSDPVMSRWVFGHRDGVDKYFQRMPKDVDIVLTHGPAYGYLDVCPVSYDRFNRVLTGSVGSTDLQRMLSKVKPFIHIHGHIHECAGYQLKARNQWVVNAAMMDARYQLTDNVLAFDVTRNIKGQPELTRV